MSNFKPAPKRFVIRKYIVAKTAIEALRKERNVQADECWIDEKYEAANLESCIGFNIDSKKDDFDE